jgi:TonB family protein
VTRGFHVKGLAFIVAFVGFGFAAEAQNVDHDAAASSGLPTINFVLPPEWARGPTVYQFTDNYPVRAQRLGMTGLVLLTCVIDEKGSPSSCSTVVETPTNQSFGPAAVRLSRFFKLPLDAADGRPVTGASVNIPVQFRLRGVPGAGTFKWQTIPETVGPPADVNAAGAIANVCAPYVLDKVDPDRLPTGQLAAQDDGWRGLMFPPLEGKVLRVGGAGFVHVAVYADSGVRHCDLSTSRADTAAVRAAILKVLAARPEGFTSTKSRYLSGRFESEDLLCAASRSPHPGAFVRLLAQPATSAPTASIFFSLTDLPTRMQSCDHEGVALAGRTLAGP